MINTETRDILLNAARTHIHAAQVSLRFAGYKLSLAEIESLAPAEQRLINIVRELDTLDSDVLLALLREPAEG